MTSAPSRHRLWVGTYPAAGAGSPAGRGEGIWSVTMDRSGAVLAAAQVVETAAPSFLCHGLGSDVLYAVNEEADGRVSAFRKERGGLIHIGSASTGGADPCHLVVVPALQAVVVANYTSGSVAVIPVGSDGGFVQPVPRQLIALAGSGPDPVRQAASHAHYLLPTPGGRELLVSDLGGDTLRALRIDTVAGRLVDEGEAIRFGPGTGPRHAVFSGDGRRLYVVGELDGSISTVDWDGQKARGRVIATSEAAPNLSAQPYLSHITRSGDQLLVGCRSEQLLARHDLRADGMPELSATISLPGEWPRHHAHVDGMVLVALQEGGEVVSLGGQGEVLGKVLIPSPACVLPEHQGQGVQ